MPTIKLSVPHQLGVEEAKRRISHLVSDAKSQFGSNVTDVREEWTQNTNEFSFRAMGFSVSGNLEVNEKTVDGEILLPFAALPFKGRIEEELSTRARELLA